MFNHPWEHAQLPSIQYFHLLLFKGFRELEEQRWLKNHNENLIELFGTKAMFLSRTGARKMMGSWQACHFVRNFDADLVGCV